jgi:hypothetical protein
MADDVSFLQEIDDSLRAERMEQFWKQHGLKILLACAAVIAATAVTVLWKDHLHAQEIRQTSVILHAQSLFEAGKYEEAAAAYAQGEEGAAGLGTLAKIRRAQALLSAGHKEAALTAYRDVASDSHADVTLRDLAALRASALDPAHCDALLAQAAQAGHPYATTAREMQAARLIQEGKKTEARVVLVSLLADDTLPSTERERAGELENLLDGEKP